MEINKYGRKAEANIYKIRDSKCAGVCLWWEVMVDSGVDDVLVEPNWVPEAVGIIMTILCLNSEFIHK